MLGAPRAKALAMATPVGTVFLVGGVVFLCPSHVFHGWKPGPFLDKRQRRNQRHTLPEGVTVEIRLGRDVSFGGCPPPLGARLTRDVEFCIVKSELLHQGM